jgi:hypothetical protein
MPTQLRISSLDVSPDGTVDVVTTRIGDGPSGIFYAQGIKTNVLFFTRGRSDKANTKGGLDLRHAL